MAPLSMVFSRQEYWSGLPFTSPEGLPNPRIKPASPALQVGSLLLSQLGSPFYYILGFILNMSFYIVRHIIYISFMNIIYCMYL